MRVGGGEAVGIRLTFGVSHTDDGGGASKPFDIWISVNILSSPAKPAKLADNLTGSSSSCSEESMSPLSTAACWEAEDEGGTSLPATSAYPTGWGVDVIDLKLVGLRETLTGETAACGCWYWPY